jgi:uncharacterized protein YjbI with pentapeptide repeats
MTHSHSLLQSLGLFNRTLSGSNFSNFIFKANSFCGADTNMPVLERLDLRSCQLNDSSLEENAFADCYLDVLYNFRYY